MTASPPPPRPTPADAIFPDPSAPAWTGGATEAGPEEASGSDLLPGGGSARYEPGSLLGEGGMGRVRIARDRVLLRDVAFKELSPRLGGRADARRRMAREAWITSQLDHPGIVAVHDAGTLPDGRPYYAMRLVRGRSLAEALADAPDARARLALVRHFLAACEAVAYAHDAGIVHRDLKPANILIGAFGETQVVDWGLARPTEAAEPAWRDSLPEDADAGRTALGAVVGTPAWMSPEQARGEPPSPAGDVWGLGAVLYALLTGGPPYPGGETGEVLRQLRSGPPPPVATFAPDAPPELAAIASRALAWSAADRYPDAGALAADVARWFEGRRVEAYSYTALDLLRRLVRAWRVPLGLGLAAAVAVTAAVAVGWHRTGVQRDRAVSAEAEARAAGERSDRNLARILVERARTATAADDRAEAEGLAAAALELEDSPGARGVIAAFGLTPRPRLLSREPAPACAWTELSDDGDELLCGQPGAVSLHGTSPVRTRWSVPLAASEGGALAPGEGAVTVRTGDLAVHRLDRSTGEAMGVTPGIVGQWTTDAREGRAAFGNPFHLDVVDLATGARLSELPCPGELTAFALGPGGGDLAALCGDGVLWLGLTGGRTRRIPTPYSQDTEATRIALAPDGGTLVVGTHRGRVALFDLVGGREIHHSDTPLGTVKRLRLSPDGGRAAVSGTRGDVRVLDVASGRWVASLPAAPGSAVAFPTADTLVVAGRDVSRWSLPGGPPRHRFPTSGGVSDLAPSPDGSRLALALGDGHVQVVDLATGESDGFLPLGRGVVKAVGYSPDAALLAATGMQGRRLVAVDARTFRPGPGLPALSMRRLAFLAGGEVLGLVYGGGLHRVRPPYTGDPGERFTLDRDGVDLATSPDGGYAVALDMGGGLYGVAPGKGVERLATVPGALAADVSRGGQRLAVATGEEVLVLGAAGEVVRRIPAPGAGIRDIALSPDGRILAAGGLDGVARIWSVEGGALLAELYGHGDRIARVEFGPDGSWLATGSWDRSARRWDLSGLSRPAATVAEEVRRGWGGEAGGAP